MENLYRDVINQYPKERFRIEDAYVSSDTPIFKKEENNSTYFDHNINQQIMTKIEN